MEAPTSLASPDAAREFLDARRGVFRAIDVDHQRGVSANKIADMVAPAISRPVVLAYLTAKQLRQDARDAVREAQLDERVDIAVTGEIGRGARVVYLTTAVDPREFTAEEAAALLGRVTDALRSAGIALVDTADGVSGESFRNGEQIQLGRL
jgi:hypothetical protein